MKIYWYNNKKNIIGEKLKKIRQSKNLTQAALAAQLQLKGFETDRLTILRIEQGSRFVADYELKMLCEVLQIPYTELLD